ncbi:MULTISPECIES: type VII secretion target [unclassified Micromonospora]|uniref:type VII secretion target n=1 Tax=unclassified Micromonospora TaxID=2617518 RepID=UPI002E1CB8CD|nr:type VII secretion target [Micromonospora sp. NBC_00858]
MDDGFAVEAEEIRTHAHNIEALAERFAAVKAASAHITQDDSAYGLLCGWISGVLEGKHTRQDELFADVEENLRLAAAGLRQTADGYDAVDDDNATLINGVGSQLTP